MTKARKRARVRAYLAQAGSACPYCDSPQIEGDSYDHEAGVISQRVDCLECRRYWFDEYTLSGIIEGVDPPCPKT